MEVRISLKSLGKTLIYLVRDARNCENELIAGATTDIVLLDKNPTQKAGAPKGIKGIKKPVSGCSPASRSVA